jgi:hypothetical protein
MIAIATYLCYVIRTRASQRSPRASARVLAELGALAEEAGWDGVLSARQADHSPSKRLLIKRAIDAQHALTQRRVVDRARQ